MAGKPTSWLRRMLERGAGVALPGGVMTTEEATDWLRDWPEKRRAYVRRTLLRLPIGEATVLTQMGVRRLAADQWRIETDGLEMALEEMMAELLRLEDGATTS